MERIYLDYAATAPLCPEAEEAMRPFWSQYFANPSSQHEQGQLARAAEQEARAKLAKCLDADPEEFILTSGGTEANNLVLFGLVRHFQEKEPGQPIHLITSRVEHSAVLEPCKALANQGIEVTFLPVGSSGRISPEVLKSAIKPSTKLVSLIHVNNETGSLQDLQSLGSLCREAGVLFHTDAVQSVGKLPLSLQSLPIDYLSASSHKFHGPKGIGFLYYRKGAPKPHPLLLGGSQEQGLRAGTTNLAGLVGMASALEAQSQMAPNHQEKLGTLTDWTLGQLKDSLSEWIVLNTPELPEERFPGIINISVPGLQGESLVLQLSLRGFDCSSGSACHAEQLNPSHVVLACYPGEEARALGTLRLSLGEDTQQADLERLISQLKRLIPRLLKS